MANLAETIHKELLERYKKDKPNTQNILVEYSDDYSFYNFEELEKHAKRYKPKSFHLKSIEKQEYEKITPFAFGIETAKQSKNAVTYDDITGVFKVTFSTGEIMYYAKWINEKETTPSTEGLYATEAVTWHKFLKLLRKERRRTNKPKTGIYRIYVDEYNTSNLYYDKIKKLVQTPVIHPTTEDIVKDVDFFYQNTNIYTRFGMPGTRKIMLVGEPGTGKSSICIQLAKKYAHTKSVVFATDIVACAVHLQKCARYGMSTLVILEDAESTLQNADSSVLNFLDGIDQPQNKQGAYIMMTTNFPNRIEPRILKRPGRVDKILKFGALEKKYALECAEIYFQGILFRPENEKNKEELRSDLEELVDGMTGAQIKELAQSSVSYAVSNQKEVDIETIKEVKEKLNEALKEVYKYAEDNSLSTEENRLGFLSNYDTKKKKSGNEDLPF